MLRYVIRRLLQLVLVFFGTTLIVYWLMFAGRSDPVFGDEAITLIHANSRGKPRAVNNLALAALLAARVNDKPIVDEASARAAITETSDHAVL